MLKSKNFILTISTSLVLVVLSLFIWYFGFEKTTDKISILEKRELETKETEEEIQKRNMASVVESLFKDESKKINQAFVSEEDLVSFFESLESLGKKAGVEVRINQALLENGKSLFKIDVDGSFPAVYRYIGALEFFIPTVLIESMSLQFIENSRWRASLEFKLLN